MKRSRWLFTLLIISWIVLTSAPVGAEPDNGSFSILRVIGHVEFEQGADRRQAVAGQRVSADTRVRLAPQASLQLVGEEPFSIRIMGQGTWRLAELIGLARAQYEAELMLLGLNDLVGLPAEILDALLTTLEVDLFDRGGAIPPDFPGDSETLMSLYSRFQDEYESGVRDVIAYLEQIEPNGETYTKALFARVHLLIDHFAYADALEQLGRYLRQGATSASAQQRAYLLQAVGFLGLGNRGSARHYLRVAQDLDPQSEVARAASVFLEKLP